MLELYFVEERIVNYMRIKGGDKNIYIRRRQIVRIRTTPELAPFPFALISARSTAFAGLSLLFSSY